MAKLKVFRTAIGFHDAYVAAPSMKAALAAWGAGSNLFAQGLAETVDDPERAKAPLAAPGTVIKVVRGSEAEHFAALGQAPAKPGKSAKATKPEKTAKPKPRPNRAKRDAAEAALADLEAAHEKASAALARKEAALRDQRKQLETAHRTEATKLQAALKRADAEYEAAMEEWRI